MTYPRRLLAALIALAPTCFTLLSSCRDATQVKVTVRTDLPCEQVRGRGTSITVGRGGDDLETRPAARISLACDSRTGELGEPVFVPAGDERDADFAFKIVMAVSVNSVEDCVGPAYEGCVVARRILHYVPQTTLYLDVLMSAACVGIACDATTTCSAKECRSAVVENPERCERFGVCSDGGSPLAGEGGAGGAAGAGGAGGVAGSGGSSGAGGAGGGPTVTVSTFATGYNHTCAFAAGALQCWGQQGLPAAPPPDDWSVNGRDFGAEPVTQNDLPSGIAFVATGYQQACAGTGDKEAGFSLLCFGGNERSVLGNQSPGGPTAAPTEIDHAEGDPNLYTQLAAGRVHTCGIKAGNVVCWGSNDDDQRGINGSPEDYELSTVTDDGDWVVLDAGEMHTCGVRSNGEMSCWGKNDRRQLGHDDPGFLDFFLGASSVVPVPSSNPGGRWLQVSAGTAHSCAILSDRSLWCWGRNDKGQANPALTSDLPDPALVQTGLAWADVAAGELHTCGTSADRKRLYCWGDNEFGQLGGGVEVAAGELVEVSDPEPEVSWGDVDAGGFHTCASKGSTLYCWGNNDKGQLGLGARPSVAVPTRVPFAAAR